MDQGVTPSRRLFWLKDGWKPSLLGGMEALKFFNSYEDVKRHTTVLPHCEQPGATYFVTFRLVDALPQKKLEAWKLERASWIEAHPKPWTEEVERAYHDRFPPPSSVGWMQATGAACCVTRGPHAWLGMA